MTTEPVRVYLIGGSADGQHVDEAPAAPQAFRLGFQQDGKRWEELYMPSDEPVVDGRQPRRFMGREDLH
jgi:hypothetical protein